MIDTEALRKKVIELAIQGKLTEQLPSDGDAETLYAQIQEEKEKLIKEGRIKKEKALPPISDEEIPYKIPSTWKWVRLATLYEINPKVEADNKMRAAFIPMEMISAGFSKEFSYEEQDWLTASKNHTKFQNDDVAFAKISPCFENRKSFIARNLPNGIGGGTTELIILRQKHVLPEYTYYVVLDQRFISAGSMTYKGIVGQQRVKSDVINNYLVALPPLAEQKRIVEKLDTVLNQIDIIDDLQQQYESDLSVLKGKIIDAGIRGKLTEQLPEDGDAETLYSQIQEEKAKLIKEGKIKKEKPLPEIDADEIPFEIPKNWKWVRLGDISSKISSGNTPAGGKRSNAYVEQGFCFFREQNIYDDGIHEEGMVYISKELLDTRPNSTVLPKDILLNITGGSIGRCAIIPDDFSKGSINQHILIIRMIDERLRYYIHHCLCSPFMQKYIKGNAVGDKDGFSGGRCKNMLIPLPPVLEQERICNKTNAILEQV